MPPRGDGHRTGRLTSLSHDRGNVLDEIRLAEYDDRLGAASPGHREVPLDGAAIHRLVEAEDHEHGVDVCRHDLLAGFAARRLAREDAAPREDRLNQRASAGRIGRT